MTGFLREFARDDAGASAAEYALVVAIVGTGIAGAAAYLGQKVSSSMVSTGATIEKCSQNGQGC